MGPARLRPDEVAVAREAADALLFCADIAADEEARRALDHLDEVVERLVEAGRLRAATGETLLDAVEACGPHPVRAPL
jgi:hypothetical protein